MYIQELTGREARHGQPRSTVSRQQREVPLRLPVRPSMNRTAADGDEGADAKCVLQNRLRMCINMSGERR